MEGTTPRARLNSAAPRLSEAQLDALRRYVPPSPEDPDVQAQAQRRVMVGRKIAAYWAGALGLTAVSLYAIAQYTSDATTAWVVPIVAVLAIIVAGNCSPANREPIGPIVRLVAGAPFTPLMPAEAEVVLSFLYRHPEAAEAMAGWMRHIPHLRRHEFATFESLFRQASATASAAEVQAVLDQFDLVIPRETTTEPALQPLA
jgi:hypothetical protein